MKHEGYTITFANSNTTWCREYKMAKMYACANAGATISKRMVEVAFAPVKVVHVLNNEDGTETVIGYTR
jgi:hypothetical protein